MRPAALVAPVLVLILMSSEGHAGADSTRLVSYSELQPTLDSFSAPNVSDFSDILFDIQKYQMIIGARDVLYRLSVRGLQLLESVSWPAAPDVVSMCEKKGQSSGDCHNFIRVLHARGERLLACGTHAFDPQCTWRGLESLRTVYSNLSGVALCPYSPRLNVTSLMTSEGELVSATATDFSGLDPAIFRRGEGRGVGIRTTRYDSRLLNEPHFVGSFETADHAYFIFREKAMESRDCEERVYARIGRVCKNDAGSRRGAWTTFTKARLNCSVSGEYPFYLDHVQSVHYLEREEMLYATFTTPENSITGTAVCAFSLSAITAAFDGPYLLEGVPQPRDQQALQHFQCAGGGDFSGHQLTLTAQQVLAAQAVEPTRRDPLLLAEGVSLTKIATDVITTKHHLAVHVIFASDAEGQVRKLVVVPRSQKTCLVELLQPFPTGTRVLTMKLLKEEGALYLGTESGVVALPVQRCARYLSEDACLAAGDPYCGWDAARRLCSPPPGRNPDVASWRQLVTQCPDLSLPVDGGWSSWGDWHQCRQVAGALLGGFSQGDDYCLCRRRSCSSPGPANGGAACAGLTTEVTNCTRHGGWTQWSAWSACSRTCGDAVKSRRRSCTNPAPVHGGRPCVGEESQEIYCHSNPPCPSKTSLPVDGGWGEWGSWGRCSSRCGGGFRQRKRACDRPRPVNGGRHCLGCAVDYGECSKQQCPEQRRMTAWTPWLAVEPAGGSGQQRQQRFRFACRAPVAEASLIRLSTAKTDERYCSADGVCSPAKSRGLGWGDWSGWSECSQRCGGGSQWRSRVCEGDERICQGPHRVEQECNTFSCAGDWTCWSEWSPCSVTCGVGHRSRSRLCRNKETGDSGAAHCDGEAISREACEAPSCTSNFGWESWSVWSLCDVSSEQHRIRHCKAADPTPDLCQGHAKETRICVQTDNESVQSASTAAGSGGGGGFTVSTVVGGCIASFLLGGLLSAVATYYFCVWRLRRQRDRPAQLFKSSLKQKMAAPNMYVSVGSIRGVNELAELKNRDRVELPPKGPLPPLPTEASTTSTIRRSGDYRYRPVNSSEDLRTDLSSDMLF